MNGCTKILPAHLKRHAVVYLRRSDPRQVRQHHEERVNQRALRNRLLEFGWKPDQVSVIDEDQGLSAKHVAGREGFQKLVADVGLARWGSLWATKCRDSHRLCRLASAVGTVRLVRYVDRRQRRHLSPTRFQ